MHKTLQVGDIIFMARKDDAKRGDTRKVFPAVVMEVNGEVALSIPRSREAEYNSVNTYRKKMYQHEVNRVTWDSKDVEVWASKEDAIREFRRIKNLGKKKRNLVDILYSTIGGIL